MHQFMSIVEQKTEIYSRNDWRTIQKKQIYQNTNPTKLKLRLGQCIFVWALDCDFHFSMKIREKEILFANEFPANVRKKRNEMKWKEKRNNIKMVSCIKTLLRIQGDALMLDGERDSSSLFCFCSNIFL